MNDLIEKIGPFLGVAAFLGLAILAFLIFQQAREVRRLREWAGRGPERAGEAAEASAAAAEARGESVERPELAERGRIATWWAGVRARFAPRWAGLNRRMPVDPRYLLAVLAAGVVAAAVLTSGFGLLGGDGGESVGGGGNGGGQDKPEKIEVAVLNATQVESEVTGEIAGVQGLADEVADRAIKPAGYSIGEKTDATSGLNETVVMFDSSEDGEGDPADNEREAQALADAVTDQLGETQITPMVQEVRDLAGGAPLALVIGLDDEDF